MSMSIHEQLYCLIMSSQRVWNSHYSSAIAFLIDSYGRESSRAIPFHFHFVDLGLFYGIIVEQSLAHPVKGWTYTENGVWWRLHFPWLDIVFVLSFNTCLLFRTWRLCKSSYHFLRLIIFQTGANKHCPQQKILWCIIYKFIPINL